MERRHDVVVRQSLRIRLQRVAAILPSGIAASFQHDDVIAGFRQAGSDRAATGTGADHDVVAFRVVAV